MKNKKQILIVLFISYSCLIFGQKSSLNDLSDKLKFFNSESLELRKSAFKNLDSIAEILKKDKLYYEIESHSCMRGESKWNLIKTQKRAELIKKELVKRGIDSLRIIPVGYGETERMHMVSTRGEDTINERVVIKTH